MFRKIFSGIQTWLQTLSFKTGLIVLGLCIPCYILSFAQMALDISISLKGTLWIVFFGLAKTFQYSGLLIIGAEGVKRLKAWMKKYKERLNQYKM
ncbi:MAG: hypothetical protein J1F12_05770 [Muribaculaceae bacterium]|nr:hypothetical protein [Muribaculaceae bacterium]